MKKSIFLSIILLFSLTTTFAETKEERKQHPHELRIGVADGMIDFAKEKINNAPNMYLNSNYVGMYFVEYQYRLNHWLGLGMQVRASGAVYDYKSAIIDETTGAYTDEYEIENDCYRVSTFFMPKANFTYYHHPWVNLYSSVGLGLLMESFNTGINNLYGTLPVTFLGVSVGKKQWFGAAEIGYLFFFDKYDFSPAPLSIINLSFGYRF